MARDIFALLDRLGIDRVKAIGMSAGANTLLHMATQRPPRVAAMIHVSGTPRFSDQARLIMRTMTEFGHGDRDPLYPVELAVELLRSIPNASLWVVPNGGHGPIFGDQAGPFVKTAAAFLA